MTERLDRIEAAIERTRGDIDDLLGAIASNEAEVQALCDSNRRNEKLFETIRAEAQADREETRRLWNDAVSQMEQDRVEARERADADRAEAARQFDEAMARADADREESTQRFDRKQQVIEQLLVELIAMNRDNRRLSDRVGDLEQREAS